MALILAVFLSTLAWAKDLARDPVLFHAGTRAHLAEDIAAGTVPQKAWDEFVFGKTNFDLPAYRKGLYGAENFAGTSLYSLYNSLGGGEAWVVRVHLKPECTSPDALFAEDYSVPDDPAKGGRFSKWYNARRDRYRALESDCLIRYDGQGTWETGSPYNVSQADPETQRLTRLCTPVLDDFLRDSPIKLVSDAVNDDSWYLRDRSCIASIDGTADQLFTAILDEKVGDADEDFARNFYGDIAAPGIFFSGNTLLFLRIAAETTLLDKSTLPRLAALDRSLSKTIGEEVRAPEKLRLDNNADNLHLLRLAVRALGSAVRKGHAGEIRASLSRYLRDAIPRLGSSCDGQHGVKNEKRAACEAATVELSRQLVKLLR